MSFQTAHPYVEISSEAWQEQHTRQQRCEEADQQRLQFAQHPTAACVSAPCSCTGCRSPCSVGTPDLGRNVAAIIARLRRCTGPRSRIGSSGGGGGVGAVAAKVQARVRVWGRREAGQALQPGAQGGESGEVQQPAANDQQQEAPWRAVLQSAQ